MVATPTLTASASNSAISASDNPESCWRLSAQNQDVSAPFAPRSPSDKNEFEDRGQDQRRAEQQCGEHAKPRDQRIAGPEQPAATAKIASAAALWNISQRRCACCQACGCAAASTGSRIALARLVAAAISAPATLMTRPAIHHSRFSVSSPGIGAP